MGFIDLALRNRAGIFTLIVMIVTMGFVSYKTLPRESSPDITIPFVIVSTFYFGTSPEDMENLVTKEIETKLSEIDKIKEMRSQSSEGASVISIEFDADEDVDDMLSKVREKVEAARAELPADAEDPMVSEVNFSAFPVLLINVSGEYGPAELKDVAEDIQDELETIPGVLDVGITGGLEREVQVNVDPEKLRHFRLSLDDVQNAIRNENLNMPGGSMDVGAYSYLLRVPGEIATPSEIGGFVVKADEHFPIYVRDLASVTYGFKDRSSTARMDGTECVTISLSKRSGENLITIVEEARARIGAMLPKLPPTTRITFSNDQSKDIKAMVDELENGIINALILVMVVLVFFLGFRTSLIVATAIPLSMLMGMIIIQALGYTLNMIVLFSLILALGMLVDNAVVVVENIYRFMQEGHKPFDAASKATKEVAWPIIGSTLTTLGAFLPMVFWPGIMGEFMSYLPITLIIVLSSSLFIAMTINPVIAGWLLRIKKGHGDAGVDHRDAAFAQSYKRVLTWALNHRVTVVVGAHALLLVMIVLNGVFGTGTEFFPAIDPKKVYVDFELPSGSRMEATDAYLRRVEAGMGPYKDVQTYVAQAGVGTSNFDMGGPTGGPANKGRVSIDMVDREYRERPTTETMADLRAALAGTAGAKVVVQKMEEGPPTGKPVTIEISGQEFRQLGDEADRIMAHIKGVKGLVNLQSDFDRGKPEIQIRVDRERAAYLGISTAQIGGAVRTAFNGAETGSFREDDQDVDITVRFDRPFRKTVEDVQDLNLVVEGGKLVPLSSVADVQLTTGLGGINRVDQKRVVTVTADVEGRLPNEALVEVKGLLKDYELPTGYSLNFAGQSKEQDEAEAFLGKAFMIAIFLIGLVLVSQFKSLSTPLVIIFTVLLSLIGVFFGLLVTRMPFGIIMTGIGVISLAGVVVNNAIVLLDYTIQLRERGLSKFDALIQAGATRLRPVLLTAACTVLGLVPMAVGISFDFKHFQWVGETDSTQWWQGMAIAVIFGMTVATVLTLVVVPVFYSLIDGATVKLRKLTAGWVNQE
ncbi:MAG: efflux RND transporter permease subunit [Candidatus Delongbacteria bacterium]